MFTFYLKYGILIRYNFVRRFIKLLKLKKKVICLSFSGAQHTSLSKNRLLSLIRVSSRFNVVIILPIIAHKLNCNTVYLNGHSVLYHLRKRNQAYRIIFQ